MIGAGVFILILAAACSSASDDTDPAAETGFDAGGEVEGRADRSVVDGLVGDDARDRETLQDGAVATADAAVTDEPVEDAGGGEQRLDAGSDSSTPDGGSDAGGGDDPVEPPGTCEHCDGPEACAGDHVCHFWSNDEEEGPRCMPLQESYDCFADLDMTSTEDTIAGETVDYCIPRESGGCDRWLFSHP